MEKNKKILGIELMKNKIVDILISIYAIMSVPLLIISIARQESTGWNPIYVLQALSVMAVITVFIFRKKLSRKIKAIFNVAGLFFLCIIGIQFLGIISNAKYFIILSCVFATLFLGRRIGYFFLGLMVFVFVVYAILYTNGILVYDFNLNDFAVESNSWISLGITLLIVTYSIILIIVKFEDAYRILLIQSEKSESNYRLLFEQASEGIVISDLKGVIQMVNENFSRFSGYSNEDIVGRNMEEFLISDELLKNPIRFDLLLKGETIVSERSAKAKDGSIKIMEIRANMLPDGRLQSFLRDVTEQKMLQQEIENERSFVKAIIDTMPGVYYVFEDYDKLVQWNDSLEKISGCKPEELLNISPLKIFDEVDKYKVQNGLNQAMNEGFSYFKANLHTKSGEVIPLYQTAVDFQRNGKRYLVGVGYDISSLVLTEAALKNSEENFKNIYNNTSDAIFIFNQYFEILSANQTFFSLTGLTSDDIKSINIFDYIFEENALKKVAHDVNELDRSRVVAAEYMVSNKNGQKFPVEVRSRKITYEGQPAVVTSFNDISPRKDLEKQVYVVSVKAEEEERGRIAKDLHDGLGPLLSTCKIYLHNIKQSVFKPNEKKSFKKLGELINESLTGVKEISNNLSPHILRNFGLVPALNSFLEKLSAYSQISIHCNFDAPNRYNEIVEITLYRISTELLNNTMKHSGAENASISIKEDNERLKLVYIDDGKGFDYENILEQKKGLGLFNINSRINSIGGIIIFKSSKGKGVHVTIETNITS